MSLISLCVLPYEMAVIALHLVVRQTTRKRNILIEGDFDLGRLWQKWPRPRSLLLPRESGRGSAMPTTPLLCCGSILFATVARCERAPLDHRAPGPQDDLDSDSANFGDIRQAGASRRRIHHIMLMD